VHTFLAALLSFLGFGVLPTATIADMLGELTGWLEMAKAIRRDPQGATARIWWDAFKEAWGAHPTSAAALCADDAIAEFGKRFLPVNAEDDRDTLNTADFDAMREELDKQTQIAAELRSERDALLATNAHHAKEIDLLNGSVEALNRTIVAMRHHYGGTATENIEMKDALDAVRVALKGASLPDADVANAVGVIVQERDELRAKLASAIVPQPKPERVEPGQRWAMIVTAGAVQARGAIAQWEVGDWHVSDGLGAYRFTLPVDSQVVETSMYYLGTEAK
jgi:hypothetical protein